MKKNKVNHLKLRKSKVCKLNEDFPFKIRGGVFRDSCWCLTGTTSIGTQMPDDKPNEPDQDHTRGCPSWNVAC
ncbi:hypothetical protein KORDIASMS9_00390 [Kordia sp. SMS9]|uniref:hypothetical protein n=1 Tax=Kordia sp. SMS9 TaxID=2282170 RepID=UPI000E0DB7B8|nr:hypothetical protein [Kordia sp. SMS9]AXG68200.1 hypothetical protein KORDIASMS9_00390 [Kordia sp. SMS9]